MGQASRLSYETAVAVPNRIAPPVYAVGMTWLSWFACVACVVAGSVAAAADAVHTGRVVTVHDGDTLTVVDAANVQHKVRLQGIDAPEIGQPFGTRSRDALGKLTMRKTVTLHGRGQDRYGRTLATVEVDGRDVNRQQVADGLAWHYVRYSTSAELAAAERAARRDGRGLWADKAPVPPWEWRAKERERKSATREPAAR